MEDMQSCDHWILKMNDHSNSNFKLVNKNIYFSENHLTTKKLTSPESHMAFHDNDL